MDERLLGTRWVHVFEEDTPEGAVYRPEGDEIPLSRRPREQLEIGRDGRATLYSGGADDRLVGRPATVRDASAADAPGAPEPGGADVRIVNQAARRLVVRIRE